MLNTKQMLVKVGVATTSRQDIGLLLNRDIILKLPQAIVRFLEQIVFDEVSSPLST